MSLTTKTEEEGVDQTPSILGVTLSSHSNYIQIHYHHQMDIALVTNLNPFIFSFYLKHA